MKRAILKLAFPSHLVDPEIRLDKQGLVTADNFSDVLVSEIFSRIDKLCKVPLFNLPDRVPMNGLRD